MTDKQKSLLTELAYVDYIADFVPKDMKFRDLKPYLEYQKDYQLIDDLVYYGLGDFEVMAIEKSKWSSFAIVFRNTILNTVEISFRGTEVGSFSEFAKDAFTNLSEFLISNSPQSFWAQLVFKKHKPTVLYGHSLGANLAEHVFRNHHDEIYNVFVINHYPIDKDTLDAQAMQAFGSHKFQCFVIEGDYISPLRSAISSVTYVKYIGHGNTHSIANACYNSDGSFVKIPEAEARDRENVLLKFVRGLLADGKYSNVLNLISGKYKTLNYVDSALDVLKRLAN